MAYSPEPEQLEDLRRMGIQTVHNSYAQVLGVPIGNAERSRAFLVKALEKHARVNQIVTEFGQVNQRVAYELLRLCGGSNLLVHYCRNIEASVLADLLEEADANVLRAFAAIIGLPQGYHFDPQQIIRIGLSLGRGGLGLRASSRHADLAYYASLHHSLNALRASEALREEYLQPMDSQLAELRQIIVERIKPEDNEWDKNPVHLQHKLSALLESQDVYWLEQQDILTPKTKQISALSLTAASAPESALWFTASPSSRACLRSQWHKN